MRNYWLRILLGALGIFAVGMIGVTLVRGGIAKVNRVVEGDGPITVPLGLIPFVLGGERLGNLDHVTLHRESPSRVSDVELEVELTDSLLAQGLSECRLAANLEGDRDRPGLSVRAGEGRAGPDHTFYCLPPDSTPAELVEFGIATLQPGDVEVPLLLPADLVAELQTLDFGTDSAGPAAPDSLPVITGPNADSIRAQVTRRIESQQAARGRRGDSVRSNVRRFADSIRAEARKRIAEAEDPQ